MTLVCTEHPVDHMHSVQNNPRAEVGRVYKQTHVIFVHRRRHESLGSEVGRRPRGNQPTHSRGQQLDVFITCTDQPTRSVIVDPTLISDHSLIRVTFGASSLQISTQNTLVW